MLSTLGSQLMAMWSSTWPYLVMVGAFSIIVFVHEIGHFAVAKWAGVRVERFAVGFGRELVGFTRGETRYSFNILPLGGYVKMLGQEDFDDKSNELKFNDNPRSFVNKPVGRRMLIVSAGVVMNILFACFLFMIVFMVGKVGRAPRIATVKPDSPADLAGLAPGDVITRVNGSRVDTFDEVSMAVLLSPPHELIEFSVERNGEPQEPIYVKPESHRPSGTRGGTRQMVGISPGKTREIIAVGPRIDTSKPDRPHVGDMLVEVDGIEVTDANVNRLLKMLAYAKGGVVIERTEGEGPDEKASRVRVDIAPLLTMYPSTPQDTSTVGALGLTPLFRFEFVDPRGRAAAAGIEDGDTIIGWDDVRHPNNSVIARGIRDNAERDVPFSVLKADGRVVHGFVRPERNPKGNATIMARCRPVDADGQDAAGDKETEEPKARFVDVRPDGQAGKVGIQSGDEILTFGDLNEAPTSVAINQLIRKSSGRSLAFSLRRADGSVYSGRVMPVPPGSIDAFTNMIAEDVLQIGDIVPMIGGRPSPAAQAGIPEGVKIIRIDDRPISTWTQLIDAFRAGAGTSVNLTFVQRSGPQQTLPFAVPHCLHTLLDVGPEARILRIGDKKKVEVATGGSKISVGVGHHAGMRAALTQLVGQQHVAVEFRRNPLTPVETKYVDVTADMVDPWLARVAFQPNILLAPETTLVKAENVLEAVAIGIRQTYYFMVNVYETLNRMIFTKSVGVENISGPLGIVSIGGRIARMGIVETLFFMAIISANLAVINFLPLPIVDGGLMVFLFIEKIKGSPVSLRVQVATQMIGLALIASVFVFVTYQDVVRIWG